MRRSPFGQSGACQFTSSQSGASSIIPGQARFALVLLALACPQIAAADPIPDAEIKALIDQMDDNKFIVRLNASNKLEEYVTGNKLTPAQLGIMRTYPEMPSLEQRHRRDRVIARWSGSFPSVGTIIDGVQTKTLERSNLRDWYYQFDGFYGGSNAFDPPVVGLMQHYEAARNALTTADTTKAAADLTRLKMFVNSQPEDPDKAGRCV